MKQHVVQSELMLAPEVDARVPYSRAHLYRLEDQGEFPKRKRIGANRVAWVRAEIERWLAERMEDES
ncbi:MAG: transcriptional regulator [Gammaproteobacteria bacterium]|jgi:predicted DNA-binding transcriptional regulator AlpA|nr:transcriptional regulator [Gammaproteobacteria bacterium]|tara:strand:+ start:2124 stop:2324 length:201 start_codon:yes stop_codon:yes gene_type:complete